MWDRCKGIFMSKVYPHVIPKSVANRAVVEWVFYEDAMDSVMRIRGVKTSTALPERANFDDYMDIYLRGAC